MMNEVLEVFDTRLNTLSLLIDRASAHFEDDRFLNLKLTDDMLPFGTQVAFTCNQPHNFVRWIRGEDVVHADPEIADSAEAKKLISAARADLASIDVKSAALPEGRRLEFGPKRYIELSAGEYINDFLIPNFYFHLVTAYSILRANGVEIGKANYMAHLMGRMKEKPDV